MAGNCAQTVHTTDIAVDPMDPPIFYRLYGPSGLTPDGPPRGPCHGPVRDNTAYKRPYYRQKSSLLTHKMPKTISLTFLGTCSGGGPILSRHCSSLALNFDGEIWREYEPVSIHQNAQLMMNPSHLSPGPVPCRVTHTSAPLC